MIYLITEIALYLLAAAVLGLIAGWLIWGWPTAKRIEAAREEERLAAQAAAPPPVAPPPPAATYSSRDLEKAMQREQALMERLASAERSREVLETKCAGFEARLAALGDPEAEAASLQLDLERCRQERAALTAEIALLREPGEPHRAEPLPPAPASLLSERPEFVDDLKEIKGIGPRMEGVLNAKGVYLFQQLAEFTPQDVAWVSAAIDAFPGRIERDRWVEQAQYLHRMKYGTGAPE